MDNMILKDLDNIKTFDSQLVTGTFGFSVADNGWLTESTISDSASAGSAYTRVDRSAEMLEAMLIAKDQELEAERKINDGLIKQIEYCKKNGIWVEENA